MTSGKLTDYAGIMQGLRRTGGPNVWRVPRVLEVPGALRVPAFFLLKKIYKHACLQFWLLMMTDQHGFC